ncbi:MAG: hypothetical protein JNL75_04730 [Chitinophagales bacterium]|nr:hypothetical protein [Chitinophagales bacterium]
MNNGLFFTLMLLGLINYGCNNIFHCNSQFIINERELIPGEEMTIPPYNSDTIYEIYPIKSADTILYKFLFLDGHYYYDAYPKVKNDTLEIIVSKIENGLFSFRPRTELFMCLDIKFIEKSIINKVFLRIDVPPLVRSCRMNDWRRN